MSQDGEKIRSLKNKPEARKAMISNVLASKHADDERSFSFDRIGHFGREDSRFTLKDADRFSTGVEWRTGESEFLARLEAVAFTTMEG